MGAPFCKHERRVRVAHCMRGRYGTSALSPSGPQRLRHPVHVQCFPGPIWKNEFAPQLHAVSLLQQFLANTRQHLDVTKACLALGILNIATPPSDLPQAQFLHPLTIYDWGALGAWR